MRIWESLISWNSCMNIETLPIAFALQTVTQMQSYSIRGCDKDAHVHVKRCMSCLCAENALNPLHLMLPSMKLLCSPQMCCSTDKLLYERERKFKALMNEDSFQSKLFPIDWSTNICSLLWEYASLERIFSVCPVLWGFERILPGSSIPVWWVNRTTTRNFMEERKQE